MDDSAAELADILENLGSVVRAEISRREISLSQFAKEADLPKSTAHQVITDRDVRLSTVAKVVRWLS